MNSSALAVIAAPLSLALGVAPAGAHVAKASHRSRPAMATGRVVNAAGYTMLAVARNGHTTSVRLGRNGAFKIKVGRDVTLQLLRPDNRYFGPVVLAHSAKTAFEAFGGRSASLGKVKLRADYAAAPRSLARSWVDAKVWARANASGKPIGAGNLGLIPRTHVVSHARIASAAGPAASAPSQLPPGGDPTHVGIVTAFNADITGAGVPNAENPLSAAQSGAGLFTEMDLPLENTLNADAAGVTPAELSANVKQTLRMNFFLDSHALNGATVNRVSVNCGALTYCAAGTGTGTLTQGPGGTIGVGTRWDGTVPANPQSPGVFQTQIAPNVGTDQISAGDVFQTDYHTTTGDVLTPTTLSLYFLTVPAIASYDAGAGPQSVSYPVAQGTPGTQSNPIQMTSGSLTVSLYRPQRAPLPGEAAPYYDMGHLHYGVAVQSQNGTNESGCAPQFYTALSPTLTTGQAAQDLMYNHLFPLHDTASDAPTGSAGQVGFTLDLAGCLAANGVPATGVVNLPISAVDESRPGGTDRGVQNVIVCLPGCNLNSGSGNPSGPGPTGPHASRPTEPDSTGLTAPAAPGG